MAGLKTAFVQDNHSRSGKNVLRGHNYQIQQPQSKLVRVISGKVFDVAVDMRSNSTTFGKSVGEILSAKNKRQFWFQPGFVHCFVALSDTAEFLYKTTGYWSPEHERSISWNDPDLEIAWPIEGLPILAKNDADGKSFKETEIY